jgi:hypothetical protein
MLSLLMVIVKPSPTLNNCMLINSKQHMLQKMCERTARLLSPAVNLPLLLLPAFSSSFGPQGPSGFFIVLRFLLPIVRLFHKASRAIRELGRKK